MVLVTKVMVVVVLVIVLVVVMSMFFIVSVIVSLLFWLCFSSILGGFQHTVLVSMGWMVD